MQNKYFRFISDDARAQFEANYSSNIDIANAIQNNIFKVIQLAIDNVVAIQFKSGAILTHGKDGLYITCSEMEEFFVEVSGFDGDSGLWEEGETYVCINLKGLVQRSKLNIRFAELVHLNRFKVLAVDHSLGSPRVKTVQVGNQKINLALVQAERSFFRRWTDFKNNINGDMVVQEHLDELDELDEAQDAENDVGTVDPVPLVLEGPAKIELIVSDEKSRLAAIKFLEGTRFANV
ncbi:hypothetical protein pzkkv8_127 [Klebsiella phage pzk-kv8]|nr:hypothetical protein pzkkv8_127 [Klebsiella phage pzk-kv8]